MISFCGRMFKHRYFNERYRVYFGDKISIFLNENSRGKDIVEYANHEFKKKEKRISRIKGSIGDR